MTSILQRLFLSVLCLIVAVLLLAGSAAPFALVLPDIPVATAALLLFVAAVLVPALHAIWSGKYGDGAAARMYRILGGSMMVSGAMIALTDTPVSLGVGYLGAGVALMAGSGKLLRKVPAAT